MTTKVSHKLIKTPYRKNVIINGAMDIWQRGSSQAMANSALAYLADRFEYYNDRSSVQFQNNECQKGSKNKENSVVIPVHNSGS